MIHVHEHVPLSTYTTFKVGGTARFFVSVTQTEELSEVFDFAEEKSVPVILLGGGSNTLFDDGEYNALVLKIDIQGVEFEDVDTHRKRVVVGAGVEWDTLVAMTVEQNLFGLELLSLIPGSVGASPVQNIGAYGAEAKDVIESVEVFDRSDKKIKKIKNSDCQFGYRSSIFKKEEGKNYIVTKVTFLLSSQGVVNTSYPDLEKFFLNKQNPTLSEVRDAVIAIRTNKLPDVNTIGTAGSFFKNPVVSGDVFNKLKAKYPEMVGYKLENGDVKVSLAWLLDKVLGMKGFSFGGARLYERQPLVIVAEKNTPVSDVRKLIDHVEKKVFETFGIHIEKEVVILEKK
ncbi:MAG: UDP-N-acetylmuramate dehydrogenase [Candidatus Paceibacterota bacterium]